MDFGAGGGGMAGAMGGRGAAVDVMSWYVSTLPVDFHVFLLLNYWRTGTDTLALLIYLAQVSGDPSHLSTLFNRCLLDHSGMCSRHYQSFQPIFQLELSV
jgi:hypothetical protein